MVDWSAVQGLWGPVVRLWKKLSPTPQEKMMRKLIACHGVMWGPADPSARVKNDPYCAGCYGENRLSLMRVDEAKEEVEEDYEPRMVVIDRYCLSCSSGKPTHQETLEPEEYDECANGRLATQTVQGGIARIPHRLE